MIRENRVDTSERNGTGATGSFRRARERGSRRGGGRGASVHPSIGAPARPRVISPYDVALVSRSLGAPFSRECTSERRNKKTSELGF